MKNNVNNQLPERCYSLLIATNEVIVIKRNESGYYKTDLLAEDKETARELVNNLNETLGVTKAQEQAMVFGSMFGWDVPGADPKNYDDNGKPLRKEN